MSVEDWAEIRRLRRSEGCRSGRSPERWVWAAIRCGERWCWPSREPPKYQRPDRGSKVDVVEPQICELLRTADNQPKRISRHLQQRVVYIVDGLIGTSDNQRNSEGRRKDRITPLTASAVRTLRAWTRERAGKRNCQDLWIGFSGDLCSGVLLAV